MDVPSSTSLCLLTSQNIILIILFYLFLMKHVHKMDIIIDSCVLEEKIWPFSIYYD